ncbi:MAG: hypothetical protein AOA65_2317 [Candidatus Bathyarchaeota archaeon BA1]|nr:MAG: hypothetical protein AOA65_2317 [Candidatus Bathyarchaeota archaeon BA1]
MSITVIDVFNALCFIFPAYCANAAPVIFGGGRPIDAGKTFSDGRPILGSHKTFQGFFFGLFIGTAVGFALNALLQYNILLGFMLSLGALVGDLAKSFIKRRMNRAPGSPLPIADQLDFILGALLLSLPVSPPPLLSVVIIIIVTPPIHLITNFLAHLMGLKKSLW